MKKLSFLALVAVGLLLGACADKDDTNQNAVNPGDFKDGAFIGVSLSMPSADNTATRANDELNNGIANEFAVKNATLYIFEEGATAGEDAATFVAQYTLGTTYEPDTQGPGSGKHEVQTGVNTTNITSTSVAEATKISNELAGKIKAGTKKYYAYVIINNNGQGSISAGTTFGTFKKTAFNKIGADIAKKMNIWAGGLLMTSSPISDTAGGSSAAPAAGDNYTTLVKLDKDCVFGSATEALERPAACVYVERAAVKITVEAGSGLASSKVDGLGVVVQGWQVINYEPTFFNTRQINSSDDGTTAENWGTYTSDFVAAGATKYRFVTVNAFAPTLPSEQKKANGTDAYTHTVGFRTYFAYDPHYATNANLSKTKAVDGEWIDFQNADDSYNHAYTTENTFDVAHQTWQNTTMVTLKAKVGDGSDYYTVGKDSKTLLNKTSAEAQIHNIIMGNPTVAAAAQELSDKIVANHPGTTVTVGLDVTINSFSKGKTNADFTTAVHYKINDADADYTGEGESDKRSALQSAITTYLGSAAGADAVFTNYYKGGISYYNVRIKHFGDYETPWGITYNSSATDKFIVGSGSGVNEIYFGCQNKSDGTPNSLSSDQIALGQQRFLGRYGVVRDNWYKLSIDKISKIGDAEPVDPSTTTPDTPDDEIENFIAVHVHIVPWVLRQQTVQF
jgi:hypothetical protein